MAYRMAGNLRRRFQENGADISVSFLTELNSTMHCKAVLAKFASDQLRVLIVGKEVVGWDVDLPPIELVVQWGMTETLGHALQHAGRAGKIPNNRGRFIMFVPPKHESGRPDTVKKDRMPKDDGDGDSGSHLEGDSDMDDEDDYSEDEDYSSDDDSSIVSERFVAGKASEDDTMQWEDEIDARQRFCYGNECHRAVAYRYLGRAW